MNARRIAVVPIFLLATAAHAQFRCDCTSIVAACAADVAIRGSAIEVTTDQRQCARVDYFVDGLPFVSVVVDGVERREWIPRAEPPRILVQSCQVCRENPAPSEARAPSAGAGPSASAGPGAGAGPGAASAASSGAAATGELEAIISATPVYPANARGAAGFVELDVVVDAAGRVVSAAVAAAEPPGLFDAAALAAVRRYRYPAELDRDPVTVRERLELEPPAAAAAAAPRVEREVLVGTPRNGCVRESASYNYGDTVDVGLMNACEEPLMLYGCAAGTGRSAGRWLCMNAEDRGTLLVAAGDALIGMQTALPVPSGLRTFGSTDEVLLTRAPNTEYWWVACTTADAQCRSAARDWSRSMDGQPASIDPRSRTDIAISRSY